jgi:hypothetical protein
MKTPVMRSTIFRVLLYCSLVTASVTGLRASGYALDVSALDSASKSILHIECNGLIGTGFIWADSSHALTALHLVSSCATKALVRYERAGVKTNAHVSKVLRKFDLALLKIDDHVDAPVLRPANDRPKVNDELTVLGYPLGVSAMESTPAQVRYGGKTLRDIVPDKVAAELSKTNAPNPDISIVNLLSPLTPGNSGGPILDRDGHVVAIADGGLQAGAGDSSWAIDIGEVHALMASNETVSSFAPANVLYAADQVSAGGTTVQCGDISLTNLRTQNLNELAASSDDPTGYNQLALSPFASVDKSSFRYDIYGDRRSGAAIALPAGATLEQTPFGCIAALANGRIKILVWARTANSKRAAKAESIAFENTLTANAPSKLDPAFTYPATKVLYGGALTVNRRAAYIFNVADGLPEDYAFETLAYSREVFLGVAVRRYDPGMQLYAAARACAPNPAIDSCAPLRAFFTTWAHAALGVHLTTFASI